MLLGYSELQARLKFKHIKISNLDSVKVTGNEIDIIKFTKVPASKPGVFTYTADFEITSLIPFMFSIDKYFQDGEVSYQTLYLQQRPHKIIVHYRPLEKTDEEPKTLGSLVFLQI